uniref:Reverse transcriptase zinc-binding domain-containing protein n=1 Tax=Lactuca sativa TaxID=4236 RepID=A0A9R1UKY4_LACSA|nr:hypothetical protein LSAT_V11C800425310 [Lactuca sativa]
MWIPVKINCFLWRLFKNKIPTYNNMIKRGVRALSDSCSSLLEKINGIEGGKRKKKGSISLIYTTLWMIWKTINALVFRNEKTSVFSCGRLY